MAPFVKKTALVLTTMVMTLCITGSALASDPNIDLLGDNPTSISCEGTSQHPLDPTATFGSDGGPTHVVITNWDDSVAVDEYNTIVPAGVNMNAYPDSLDLWVSEFGIDCTEDEVYNDHVILHMQARTDEGKRVEFVDFASKDWVQALFVPITADDVNMAPAPVPSAEPTPEQSTIKCSGCVEVTVEGSSASSPPATDGQVEAFPSDAPSSAEDTSDQDSGTKTDEEDQWSNAQCKAYLAKHTFPQVPQVTRTWNPAKRVPRGDLFWATTWSNAVDPNWPRPGVEAKVWFGQQRFPLMVGGTFYSLPIECRDYAEKQFDGIHWDEISVKKLKMLQGNNFR